MKIPPSQRSGRTPNRPNEIPSWLNEACNHTITAARKTIHHLCEASEKNDLVKVRKSQNRGLLQASF